MEQHASQDMTLLTLVQDAKNLIKDGQPAG
jgi:hypothetical protein